MNYNGRVTDVDPTDSQTNPKIKEFKLPIEYVGWRVAPNVG